MTFHAMTEPYEEITVCGKPALFTSIRIKRDTVPDGLYTYDVRHDDECRGIPCEIAPFVMVNHWGTIIPAERWNCRTMGGDILMRIPTGTTRPGIIKKRTPNDPRPIRRSFTSCYDFKAMTALQKCPGHAGSHGCSECQSQTPTQVLRL